MVCPVLGLCRHNKSEMNDWRLLREYLEHGSESAFTEIVRRHVDMIFSVALRKLGQPQAAQEVVQAVFCLLVRKASTLHSDVLLGPWLCQAACYKAAEWLRAEQGRRAREQEAFRMDQWNGLSKDDQTWKQMAPLLDDAIQQLRESDRQAILLRFFERKPLREVGLALRLDEDAARKRVDRAVEKLRTLLAKRGVTSTASGLAAALVTGAVITAPAGLAASVASGALTASSLVPAATSSTTCSLLKLMSIGKMAKIAAVVVLIVGGTAVLVHQMTRGRARPSAPNKLPMVSGAGLPDGAAILSAMATNDTLLLADGFIIEGTELNLPGKISFPESERGKRVYPAARYKWKLTWLSTNQIAYDKEVIEIFPWKDWLRPGARLPQPGEEHAWMSGRTLSFINADASGFFYFNGPLRPGVWSAPQAMAIAGVTGDINLYRPNPVTLSEYLEMPLWRVGRGFAKYLERISSVEALENGRLAIKVEGKPSYSRATKWEMIVEPAAGYLVRSATYYVDDSDRTIAKPRYVITTSGVKRFGSLALPEKYEQRDPFMDKEQPFYKSGAVTAGSLKGDKQFLEATAAMFQRPFPIRTAVADNRSNPPVHLTFAAGQTRDENALRQLRTAKEPKPGVRTNEGVLPRPKER
jgi:RNA polymerase sigma factor (sigma-70 family)